MRTPATISVVVPTYRRPDQLALCLAGLAAQQAPATQIVVVRREDDVDTAAVIRSWREPVLTEVTVSKPGVLAAMLAGAQAASGEVIAFIDDDAVPRPDWIERLKTNFVDPRVGGAGGRDAVHADGYVEAPLTEDVGRLTRWGRLIGNHHIGAGPPRDVMVLKGANMAFRREALVLPLDLRGTGAQPHLEVAICLWLARQGWRVVYDPNAVVDHYPGPRFGGDSREKPDPSAARQAAFNFVFAMGVERRYRWRRCAWRLLVGDRLAPGLVRGLLALPRREPDVLAKLVPSLQGQAAAAAQMVRGREPAMHRVAHDGESASGAGPDVAPSGMG